jgi:dihydrolipoamide dehydrogenase
VNHVTSTLRDGLKLLLEKQGIEIIEGVASFEDGTSVLVSSEESRFSVEAKNFIIATGASAKSLGFKFDGKALFSYSDLLSIKEIPKSLIVVGAGVIGCEFASCFNKFGVQVTLIELEPQILPIEDPEAVRLIRRSLESEGVKIMTGAKIESLKAMSDCAVEVHLAEGGPVKAEKCLIAVGQKPNSKNIGLENLKINTEPGIEVDEFLITKHRNISAIGDCLPGRGLAHWASAEGVLAVKNLYDKEKIASDASLIPRCIFTEPELAQVGLKEPDSADSVLVSRFSFAALGKSVCDNQTDGFVKLLVDSNTKRLLGATIVGHGASTLIHSASIAIKNKLTARDLADMITAHPSLPESITESSAQIYTEALTTSLGPRPARGRKLNKGQ